MHACVRHAGAWDVRKACGRAGGGGGVRACVARGALSMEHSACSMEDGACGALSTEHAEHGAWNMEHAEHGARSMRSIEH